MAQFYNTPGSCMQWALNWTSIENISGGGGIRAGRQEVMQLQVCTYQKEFVH